MAKFNRQMICLDCDEVFSYGTACPVCASRQVYPIGRWIRPRPDKAAIQAPVAPVSECAEMVAAWQH